MLIQESIKIYTHRCMKKSHINLDDTTPFTDLLRYLNSQHDNRGI